MRNKILNGVKSIKNLRNLRAFKGGVSAKGGLSFT